MSYSAHRKVMPIGSAKPQGDNDRVEIGPTALALDEWASAGLQSPDLEAIRDYRLARLVEQIQARDCGGLLMFDPLNIRYATDSTNMILWNTHNPFRATLVCPDGYMVIWDYKNTEFLTDHNPRVREKRHGADLFYFDRGEGVTVAAERFAGEVRDLVQAHGGNNTTLAVDKIMLAGLRALEATGLQVIEGEPLTERARSIKCPDEILAMKCAMYSTEVSVAAMEAAAAPGLTENDVWAVLHAENIRRGGEWIETRLLSSGPRTNPWFQECGPRVIQNNEILAFDTDLVGPYGICCDISRTWWIGDGQPQQRHKDAMRLGVDHIEHNMALLKPGVSFTELSEQVHRLPDQYQRLKYGCAYHGVGLCDEWPMIAYPDQRVDGAFEGQLVPGMVLCVEALITEDGGDFSIKLEDQVVITEDGYEKLSHYPWDSRLLEA